jgi:hypothetical protein
MLDELVGDRLESGGTRLDGRRAQRILRRGPQSLVCAAVASQHLIPDQPRRVGVRLVRREVVASGLDLADIVLAGDHPASERIHPHDALLAQITVDRIGVEVEVGERNTPTVLRAGAVPLDRGGGQRVDGNQCCPERCSFERLAFRSSEPFASRGRAGHG